MATQVKTKWIENLAITAAKLGNDIAGNGLTGGDGSSLLVQADGTTISVGASGVKVADSAIGPGQLSAQSVHAAALGPDIDGNGLTGGDGSSLAVLADGTTISVGAGGLKIADSAVGPGQLSAQSVHAAALGPDIDGNGLTGGDGSSLAVLADGTTLSVSAAGAKVADSAIGPGQLAAQAVHAAALGPDVDGNGLTGGAGSALAVQADGTTISVGASGIKVGTIGDAEIDAGAGIQLSKLSETVISADGQQALTGDWTVGGFKITDLGTPSASSDAATKDYVDTQVSTQGEWLDSALDRTGDPGALSPSTGDRYLITSSATGDWTNQDNNVAEWEGADWTYTVPTTGSWISVDDETDGIYYYGGSNWTKKYFETITAGSGLTRDGDTLNVGAGNGVGVNADDVYVDTDGTTLSVSASGVKVADSAIGPGQLAAQSVHAAALGPDVDGNGLTGGAGSALAVQADGTTISVGSGGIKVADSAIGPGQLSAQSVHAAALGPDIDGNGLTGGDGSSLAVLADGTTLSISAAGAKVADSAIGPGQLAAQAVHAAALGPDVDGNGLTGGAGSALTVLADTTGGADLLPTLNVSANGVAIKAATDPGLEDDGSNGLRVKVKTGGGITRDSDGLSVDSGAINAMRVYEYTILAADVTSKSFTLPDTMADTQQIQLTVLGGVMQNYATDYTANDSTTIGWTGLGLDGVIEEGDEISIAYPI